MFLEHAKYYYEKNYHVIPVNVKRKAPAISHEFDPQKLMWTELDVDGFMERYPIWEVKRGKFGIGLVCGEINDIIGLDLDADIDFFKSIGLDLPYSNIAKSAKRGTTMFFKYNGESTQHFNNINIDLISDGAFTVVPPTLHKSGIPYKWDGPSIVLASPEDLPDLPSKFLERCKQLDKEYAVKNKVNGIDSGRNNHLRDVSMALAEKVSLSQVDYDAAIDELIEHDITHHSTPWLSDPTQHDGDSYNQAKKMIDRAMNKVALPRVTHVPKKETKKTEPAPSGVLKDITEHIKAISPKPRDKFALASAISTLAPLLCHRFTFKGTAPNLYQVLITKSGGGKNEPLNAPKNILAESGASDYVGHRAYRSSAAVTLNLDRNQLRIDCIDEIDMLFGSINNSKGHNSETSGLLAEMYTSSTKVFMGKTTQTDGTMGACHSPCVSILGATTPDGVEGSLTEDNITRGLGGRFLFVFDDSRINKQTYMNFNPYLPEIADRYNKIKEYIQLMYCHRPVYGTATELGGAHFRKVYEDRKWQEKPIEIKPPYVKDLQCDPEAEKYYNETKSEYFDKAENPTFSSAESALSARALEFVHKVTIIHWASRIYHKLVSEHGKLPDSSKMLDVYRKLHNMPVEKCDLQFARSYIDCRIKDALDCVEKHLSPSLERKVYDKIVEIQANSDSKKVQHSVVLRSLGRKAGSASKFKTVINTLKNSGLIEVSEDKNPKNNKPQTYYSAIV